MKRDSDGYITPWGYVGYSLLYSIPIVGWIIWACHAFGSSNENVKNYARAMVCAAIAVVILSIVLEIVLVIMVMLMPELFTDVPDFQNGNFSELIRLVSTKF